MNPASNQRLRDKVVVITGGTGSIGAACTRRFAVEGANIVIGYNSRSDAAQALISELPDGRHKAVRVVMHDTASIQALAELVEAEYGRVDILVNAAGYTRSIPHADIAALDDETFDAMFVTHARGPFATIRSLLPFLRAAGRSVVVNVSSTASKRGTGSNIAYAASKAALDCLTMSLARVLGPQIRMVGVSPAGVDNSFVPGRQRAELEKTALASPLGRVTQPDDVAQAIVVAALDLPLTTGSLIIVDGGQSL